MELDMPFIMALAMGAAVLIACYQASATIARLGGKPPTRVERWVIIGAGLFILMLLGRRGWLTYEVRVWTSISLILLQLTLPFDHWGDAPTVGLKTWPGGGQRRRTASSTISVETHFLVMTQQPNGELSGLVTAGKFSHRQLDDMPMEHLLNLWQELRLHDPLGVPLLEAYLDRHPQGSDWRAHIFGAAGQDPWKRGQQERYRYTSSSSSESYGDRWRSQSNRRAWRQNAHKTSRSGVGGMTHESALSLLGLSANAGVTDIKRAHRRLMLKMHPDHGGSTEAATQLNLAKDFLLEELG